MTRSRQPGRLLVRNQRYRVEDCSVLLVQTRDGAIGSIEASWTSPGSANVIEIYGTDGAIVVDYAKGSMSYLLASTGQWEESVGQGANRFVEQAKHFVDCIRGGRKPIVDGRDGLRANEIVDAAFAFDKSGGCGWASLA